MSDLSREAGVLVATLREKTAAQSAELADLASSTRRLVWILLVAGLSTGFLVSWLISSSISCKLGADIRRAWTVGVGSHPVRNQ